MNCKETQRELSGYLDRALDWKRASEVRGHLSSCAECAGEAAQLDEVRRLFRTHVKVAPPRDLALQIRLRAARESQPSISAWARMMVRLQNFLGPVAIPASTGLLSTALIFGMFVYNFGMPLNTANDIPLALQTPAKLLAMPQINFTTSEEGVMVMTEIDQQGRVVSFQVLNGNGKSDVQQMRDLRQLMVFTTFEPATRFGVPTSSRLVINLRGISIKG